LVIKKSEFFFYQKEWWKAVYILTQNMLLYDKPHAYFNIIV